MNEWEEMCACGFIEKRFWEKKKKRKGAGWLVGLGWVEVVTGKARDCHVGSQFECARLWKVDVVRSMNPRFVFLWWFMWGRLYPGSLRWSFTFDKISQNNEIQSLSFYGKIFIFFNNEMYGKSFYLEINHKIRNPLDCYGSADVTNNYVVWDTINKQIAFGVKRSPTFTLIFGEKSMDKPMMVMFFFLYFCLLQINVTVISCDLQHS